MTKARLFTFLSVMMILSMVLSACGGPATTVAPVATVAPADTVAPAAANLPAFDSGCSPADEGTVKPVDKQPGKPMKIAVLGLENNPFWIPVKEGVMKAAEELKPYGVTVDWIIPGEQHTGDVFGPGIEAAMAQKYDAIATIAGEAGVAPFIDKAVAAGIPVATFNSETNTKNGRAFYVGADSYKQGQAAGAAMAKAIGSKGKIAIITGFLAVEAHEQRRMGLVDYLKKNAPDVVVVGTTENNDKSDVAFSQANDFMNSNPDLVGIYVTAGGPFGAAEAVQKAGKGGKVHMITYDFTDEIKPYVASGVVDGTVGQDPYAQGHDPVIRLFNMIVGGVTPECGKMATRADVATKDNMDKYFAPSTAPAAVKLPAFDSGCSPADEGAVKPVDKQPGKPMKIAVLGLENNPFWIPVKEGVMKAAEELKPYGVTVDWIIPGEQHTGDVFGPGIEAAMAQKYDAIATIAGEAGVAPFIDKAVAAGIPVATFNSETNTKNGRAFYVGANSYKQGQAAGAAMAKAIGSKGKIAIITGFLAVEAHEQRRMGLVDYLKKNAPDVVIVGTVENNDKSDVAFSQANDFMNSNPDLVGIYVTAGGPFGAAEAVQKAGKGGKVHLITYDFTDEIKPYVASGVVDGTVGQDPYAQGHDPVIRLFNMIVGGVTPECGKMATRADVATKDNMDQYFK